MTDDARPTTDAAAIESRLAAVERAVTDGETDVDGLPDAAELVARVDDIESTVERLDDRAAELEAATRALRGYVGGVRAVNESVERRADAALAAVESLEDALRDDAGAGLDAVETTLPDPEGADARGTRDGETDDDRAADARVGEADDDGEDDAPREESFASRLRDAS